MATTYTIGDTTPPITATLSDLNGNKDLTGATVTLRLKGKKTAATVVGIATVDPDQVANKGKVSYDLQTHDLDKADTYNVEWYVLYNNGKDQVFVGNTTIKVRDSSTGLVP